MTKLLQLEHRGFAVLELRASGRRLQGLAAPFDRAADLGGGVSEVIKPGAFAASLSAGGDILLLADHSLRAVLARTANGSLRLRETAAGLEFSAELVATTAANDVLAMAEARALGGMSFGFRVAKDGEAWAGNRRELRAVDLKEISVVSSWPSYEGTRVEARSSRHPSVAALDGFLATVRS